MLGFTRSDSRHYFRTKSMFPHILLKLSLKSDPEKAKATICSEDCREDQADTGESMKLHS